MTTTEDLRWANDRLESAEEEGRDGRRVLGHGQGARAVVCAASSVQCSLQAALFSVGVEPLDRHPAVPGQLHARRSRFPKPLRERVDDRVDAGQEAVRYRNDAPYGDRARLRIRFVMFRVSTVAVALVDRSSRVRHQVMV